MSDPGEKPLLPLTSLKIIIPGGLALLAIGFLIAGFVHQHLRYEGATARPYELPALGFLSFSEDAWFVGRDEGLLIVIGAMLARAAVFAGIVAAGLAIFARQLDALRLARRRGHVVVIGDTPTAREVVAYLRGRRRKFAHVVAADGGRTGALGGSRIALPFVLSAFEKQVALGHAARVILDTGDIARNIALAAAIRQAFRERAPTLSCNIESTHIADEFDELLGAQRNIVIYDEARLSVRDILARHPLYASADRQAAKRVHLLIFGFGRLGRILLEEAAQDGIAGELEKPWLTIVDRDAAKEAAAFNRDKPAHVMAADIAFFGHDVLEAPLDAQDNAGRAALFARDDAAPVSAIALCLASDADNIAAAMGLRALRRRTGRFFVPVFMHVRDRDGLGHALIDADAEHVIDPFDSVIPIALSRAALAADILGEGERDGIAKRIHQAFLKNAGDRQAAKASWAALPETFRRASRHAADHVGAKLWSLGLASERRSTETALAIDAHWCRNFVMSEADRNRIARLEHKRWVVDRVMEGYRFSDRRDDDLRYHMDLVPFDAVSPKDQQKDVEQIKFLETLIKEARREGGQRFMPELVVGLAAQRRIEATALAAAQEEIGRRVVAPLAALAAHYAITIVSSLTPGGDLDAVVALIDALEAQVKARTAAQNTPAQQTQIRLSVLEGVPYPVRLRHLFKTLDMREHHVREVLEARRKLFTRFCRVETVRLSERGHSHDEILRGANPPPDVDPLVHPTLYQQGLRRTNAYLARRADVLCVLWDKNPDSEPGGIAELVAFRTGAHAIPAKLDPGPSRSGAARPDTHMEELILIDVGRAKQRA